MKKLILIPIALTTLTPMVSMVSCNQEPKPEPEILEFELTQYGYQRRSPKFDLEAGRRYKFIIDPISHGDDNFAFCDDEDWEPVMVNVQIDKILVNGQESTNYQIKTDDYWAITSWHHDDGKAEVYITAIETTTNVRAWAAG